MRRRTFLTGSAATVLAAPVLAGRAGAQAKTRLVFALSSYPPSIRPGRTPPAAAR